MATRNRNIRVTGGAYELLADEARRRGTKPDSLADELLKTELGSKDADLNQALADLASLRAELPPIDAVAERRAAREALDSREI
jgi:hypothetical protein